MAFLPIGVHTNLILNKLRNAQRLAAVRSEVQHSASQIGCSGFVGGLECSEIKRATIDVHEGGERSGLCDRIPAGVTTVSCIESAASFSQISEPVVGSVTVDMVNLFDGPASVCVEPNQSVGLIPDPISLNRDVSPASDAASSATNRPAHTDHNLPSEDPGFWIVIQKFAQAFGSQVGIESICHDCSRNERRIDEDRRADEERRQKTNAEEKAVRAELERVKKRLDLLRSRVEPRRTGRESAG